MKSTKNGQTLTKTTYKQTYYLGDNNNTENKQQLYVKVCGTVLFYLINLHKTIYSPSILLYKIFYFSNSSKSDIIVGNKW